MVRFICEDLFSNQQSQNSNASQNQMRDERNGSNPASYSFQEKGSFIKETLTPDEILSNAMTSLFKGRDVAVKNEVTDRIATISANEFADMVKNFITQKLEEVGKRQ